MSYSNPKQIKDGVLERSEKALAMQQEASAKRQALKESTLASNVTSLVKGGVSLVTEKTNALNKLNKSIVKGEQDMYNKVGSDGYDTGFNKYDENSEAFLHGLISKYNETKNALDQDILIDSDMGKRQLAQIKNMVDIYGDAVPNIQLVSKMLKKQANATEKGEQFSVTGAPAHQLDIIKKIAAGEDVQILNEDNSIVLYDPTMKYLDEEGKEQTGARLNISEFNRALEDKDNPYLKYKVDPSETELSAYNELVKQEEGFNDNYVTIETSTNDNNEEVSKQVMTPDQQTAYIKNVTAGNVEIPTNDEGYYTQLPGGAGGHNAFQTILLKGGESIWEDEGNMGEKTQWPKSFPTPGTKEFNDFVDKQYKPALNHLAQESLTQGAIENGIDLQIEEPETEVAEEEDEKVEVENKDEEVEETEVVVEDETKEDEVEADDELDEVFGVEEDVNSYSFLPNKPSEEKVKQLGSLRDEKKYPNTQDGFNDLLISFEGVGGRVGSKGELVDLSGTYDIQGVKDHYESNKSFGKYKNGQDKKALMVDFPELKDADPAVKDMMQMFHYNAGWNPKVLMSKAAGKIDKTTSYNSKKKDGSINTDIDSIYEQINVKDLSPQEVLNAMDAFYRNTYAPGEYAKSNKGKTPPKQYGSYRERIKLMTDRYGLETPQTK